MVKTTEGKLVVLDDRNAILMLDDHVHIEQVLAVNHFLKDEFPEWNIVVFGGLAGEIVDLRGHPELGAQAHELYESVWAGIEKLVQP